MGISVGVAAYTRKSNGEWVLGPKEWNNTSYFNDLALFLLFGIERDYYYNDVKPLAVKRGIPEFVDYHVDKGGLHIGGVYLGERDVTFFKASEAVRFMERLPLLVGAGALNHEQYTQWCTHRGHPEEWGRKCENFTATSVDTESFYKYGHLLKDYHVQPLNATWHAPAHDSTIVFWPVDVRQQLEALIAQWRNLLMFNDEVMFVVGFG